MNTFSPGGRARDPRQTSDHASVGISVFGVCETETNSSRTAQHAAVSGTARNFCDFHSNHRNYFCLDSARADVLHSTTHTPLTREATYDPDPKPFHARAANVSR